MCVCVCSLCCAEAGTWCYEPELVCDLVGIVSFSRELRVSVVILSSVAELSFGLDSELAEGEARLLCSYFPGRARFLDYENCAAPLRFLP